MALSPSPRQFQFAVCAVYVWSWGNTGDADVHAGIQKTNEESAETTTSSDERNRQRFLTGERMKEIESRSSAERKSGVAMRSVWLHVRQATLPKTAVWFAASARSAGIANGSSSETDTSFHDSKTNAKFLVFTEVTKCLSIRYNVEKAL